ncbi:MAG: YfhO family protein, partial [Anaerolineae bacterium]|nr:YfhO family protein [Anaerolineae bacterium]
YAARALPGELPLWNPHLYSGAPFWADNQSGVLYPPNLVLFLLLDVLPYAALEWLVAAHIWLAGVTMYICLRLLRPQQAIRPAPAALGAVAFMLSDVFVTHQGNLNLIAVAAWLPLVFLSTWRALTAEGRFLNRWVVLAGAAFGVGTLAGHAQMTYFTGLLVGAAAVWWMGAALVHQNGRQFVLVVGRLAAIGLIAFGLSAAALLPTLELTGYTARAELTYEQAAQYSLPPRALVGLVLPGVYGRGPASFTGDWERVEVGYMGALALALALIGAWTGIRRRDGLAIFLVIVAAVALLLALGGYFPLHQLAYDLVPGMRSIRVPARFVLLFNFAGAALAALVLERWQIRRAGFKWLAAALVAAEVVLFGTGVEVQSADPRAGYDHPEAVAWLQQQPDAPFRIEGATPLWQPDSAALHGGPLYDITGISNPLALAAYDAYYWSVGQRGSALYNFLGAKYVIATHNSPPGDATFVPVFEAESGVTIFLNTQAEPLVRLVYHAEPVDTPEAAWEAIHAPDWHASQTIYVEGGPALDSAPPEGASLFYTIYDARKLAVVVRTPEPVYLLLSEVWYPGWQACIDGQPVPIYRANTAFRAVYIPHAGEHTVWLAFRPLSVIVGLVISGVTVLALAAGAAREIRRRRGPSAAT